MKRDSFKIPGYDCVRNPCGRRGCGTDPGSSHGIHCEEWHYVVSDEDLALSLTVFSGVFPDSVPQDPTIQSLYPSGTELTLHVGFPIEGESPRTCCYTKSKVCYTSVSSALLARDFWENFAGKDCGFTQPEKFWKALESKFTELSSGVQEMKA